MKHLRYLLMAALVAMPLTACDEDSDPVVEVLIYGTVTGTVSAEGTGLSGVGVTLVGATSQSATTASGGAYTFTNVEAGSYGVSIDASTHSDVSFSQTSRTTTISTSGETATVDFSGSYIRTATITGVVSASGTPLGGIAVTVTGGPDNVTNNTVTNAGGEYFATGLRAGNYTVAFTAPAGVTFATTSAAVTVGTGETKTAHFPGDAVQLATISGAVTVDNVGTAGIAVALSGAATAATETGAGGAYSFTNLTPGAYTVTVTAPANVTFAVSVKNITVGEGDAGVVNFAGEGPPEPATISGTVTVDDVGRAGVAVALAGPATAATESGAGGAFSFANLTAGVYTVTITAPANTTFGVVAKGITVAAGENGVVNFAGEGPVEPATISIQSITTGAGVPVVLTAVMGQIEVSLNIIRGDRDLDRVDVVFTNEAGTPIVAATQTFANPAPPAEAAAGDDELITLSIPTNQVRLGTTLPLTYVPVIFNGKANISANLWEVGAAAPIPTNDVPVVMTNNDAMLTSDGALIPGLVTRLNPSVSPDINTGVGLDWNTGGISYDNPIYISYSTTLQVPTWTDQAGPCGAGVGTTAGTAAAGITLHNTWACALVEGTNAGPALSLPTWVGPALGPDGTAATTPAAWSSLGADFMLDGVNRWYVLSPTSLALTAPAVWDVDNLGPMVFINGSASAVTPLAFGVNGTVAFNDTWDERWINAAFDFVADAPITLTDGGVGPDNATRSALTYDQTLGVCGAQVVNNITDFPVTVTDNGSDGHVICAEGSDLLANAPQNVPVSFYFGKDIADPDIRIHGTTVGQPLAVNIPASEFSLNGVDPALPNTSIYNIAAPFNPLFTWGVEALDDRAGFHQNVTTVGTVEAGPVVQTVSRADGWSGVPEPDVATGADYLMLILGDNYARSTTSAGAPSEWAFLGGLAQPGIYDYNVAVTDMAGNVSSLGPYNWLVDQVAGPTMAALTLGQVSYTPGAAGLFNFFGGDDLEAMSVQASMTYPSDIGHDNVPNPMELVYGALATDPAAANQRWDTDFTFQNLNPFLANVSALPTGVDYGIIGRIDFTTATGALPDVGVNPGVIEDDDFNTLDGADLDALMGDDDFLPTAVTGWVQEDAGINPASATITTPFVAMDFGGWLAATSQPYTGADIVDLTLFGEDLDGTPENDVILVGQHRAANSITPAFFDAVALVHRNPGTNVLTVCAVNAAPISQDQGGFRYYRYEFTNPIPATDVDVCTGPASLDVFHAVGVKDTGTGRALLVTDPAVSIIFP